MTGAQEKRRCSAVREWLLEPDGASRRVVQSHLAECEDCSAFAAVYAEIEDSTQQLGNAATEPLQVERVWQGVRRQLQGSPSRRSPPRWSWGLVGGVVATIAVLVVWWWSSDLQEESTPRAESAQLIEQGGDVRVLTGATSSSDVSSVAAGSTVQTGENGWARLAAGPSQLVARPNTKVALVSARMNDLHWRLDTGTLLIRLKPESRLRVHVETPGGWVEVTGTILRVHATAGRAELSVLRGLASFRIGRQMQTVRQGESLSVLTAAERPLLEHGSLPASHRDELIQAFSDQDVAHQGPKPTKRPAKSGSRWAHMERALREGRCEEAERLAGRQVVVADRGALAWTRVAECHNAAQRLRPAAVAYQRVIERYPDSPHAEVAAYEIGRIARELGKLHRASRAFSEFLAKHPRGRLAADAQYWTCWIHAEQERFAQALTCIERYRRRFPRHHRVDDSLLLQATCLRKQDDCAAAIDAYNSYLRAPGEDEESARRWRDWCVRQGEPGTPER